MNCAHVKVITELFGRISEGRIPVSYVMLFVIPPLCAAVVQFFVLGRAKKRFIGFIPLIMVAMASLSAELIYAGVLPMGESGGLIGMIYAGAAMLCYVGLAVGAALWFAAGGGRKKML